MTKQLNKGVSAGVKAIMAKTHADGKDMAFTVAKLMKDMGLPVHRARAYYRTFVKDGSAPGTLPARVKAEPKAKAPKAPKVKAEKPAKAKPLADTPKVDRKAALMAAAKKLGIHRDAPQAPAEVETMVEI